MCPSQPVETQEMHSDTYMTVSVDSQFIVKLNADFLGKSICFCVSLVLCINELNAGMQNLQIMLFQNVVSD